MMITRQTLQQKRQSNLEIAERYGASDVRVFGSVARGDASEQSDLDLIVRFAPDRSLLDHAIGENELSKHNIRALAKHFKLSADYFR
jgi:predicted nucleotidyltransferase